MINSRIIENKWHSIDTDEISEYRFLRLTIKSKPELNIGFNTKGNRCLILELPKDFSLDTISITKENLSIEYIKEYNYLVIELINIQFKDLFNDLALSIYHKVKDLIPAQQYTNEFILTFRKWVEFFGNRRTNSLSEEQIQGLFGELFILKQYLKKATLVSTNSILKSWKGLYDAAKDFEFELKDVEVKTKLETKHIVNISSEFQLEKNDDKGLELLVVTVKIDRMNGKSIHDILIEIKKQIKECYGDLSIFYKALNQKGLTAENLKQYNNHRFKVLKAELFDAASEDFPKLSKSNIVNEISNLKYKLRVTHLDQFLIESKKY